MNTTTTSTAIFLVTLLFAAGEVEGSQAEPRVEISFFRVDTKLGGSSMFDPQRQAEWQNTIDELDRLDFGIGTVSRGRDPLFFSDDVSGTPCTSALGNCNAEAENIKDILLQTGLEFGLEVGGLNEVGCFVALKGYERCLDLCTDPTSAACQNALPPHGSQCSDWLFEIGYFSARHLVDSLFTPLRELGGTPPKVLILDAPYKRVFAGYRGFTDPPDLNDICINLPWETYGPANLARYVRHIKDMWPDLRIGFLVNFPNWNYSLEDGTLTEDYFAIPGVGPAYNNYRDFREVLDLSALGVSLIGAQFDFVEVDAPFEYTQSFSTDGGGALYTPNVQWRRITDLRKQVEELNMQFGTTTQFSFIFISKAVNLAVPALDPLDPCIDDHPFSNPPYLFRYPTQPGCQVQADLAHTASMTAFVEEFKSRMVAAGLNPLPDIARFASWYLAPPGLPTLNLPDSEPRSFTYAVKQAIEALLGP